jgi:FkbM family methyltransferase
MKVLSMLKNLMRSRLFGVESCNPIYATMLKGHPPIMVDIGAAEGLQPQWAKLIGASQFYLFEPDSRSRESLRQWADHTGQGEDFEIFGNAFSDKQGQEKLLLTNVRTGSTIMQIDESSEGYHHLSRNYFFPVVEEVVQTTTLDAFSSEHKVNFDGIKIDTQGAEFKILKGAQQVLKDALVVDFEVGVVRLYKDQAPFQAVFDLLEEQGFGLFDVRVSRSFLSKNGESDFYLKKFSKAMKYQSLSARSWEFDCVFLKNPEILLKQGNLDKLIKLISLYCVYNFYAEAWDLVERMENQKLFSTERSDQFKKQVLLLHKLNQNQNRWSFFTQRVKELKGIQRKNYWSRFVWMDYPNS